MDIARARQHLGEASRGQFDTGDEFKEACRTALDLLPKGLPNPLSLAQKEALELIARGYDRGDIAQQMHVGVGAVGQYASRAVEKLKAVNVYHAIYIAMKNGWIT